MKTFIILICTLATAAFAVLAVHETLAANHQRLLATVYQENFEALARTMHGQVSAQYTCRLKAK